MALALLAIPPAGAQGPKWGPHLDLEGKLGNNRDLGEADFFLPLLQNDASLLFGNLKARLDDNASREGNFGLGFRHMLEAGWNLGAYGYFDRRRTERHNFFNQVTVGAEALSLDWDFRANAYLPQGRRSHNVDSLNTAEISGASVVFRGGEERSLAGFDAEIGWRVPLFDGEAGRQLRLFAGAYRFYADQVAPVQGPRARTELTFDEVPFLWSGSRLALGGEIQRDTPRGTTGFASARLRLPLQIYGMAPARLTPMERRMADPVVRDIDVVSQAGAYIAELVTTTASGTAFTVISSTVTGGAALPAAVTAAGANSTVILAGTFNTTATTTLQSGQTLMGGGTLSVRSAAGRTATLSLSPATIAGATGGGVASPTLDLASNSRVTGLTISNSTTGGTGAVAVRFNNANNATLSNNTITASETGAAATQAVLATGTTNNSTVSGNTISASGAAGQQTVGLAITATVGITVSGNTLSATGGGGANNQYLNLNTAHIQSGSTGNTAGTGNCTVAAGGTGTFIAFSNAANCGP